MSNCVQPASARHAEFALDPRHFDHTKLVCHRDSDGNEVFWDDTNEQWVVRMGQMTTLREWRSFLWDHVQPAVLVANVRVDMVVREESDGFADPVKWPVCFQPPGTKRPTEPGEAGWEAWRKIF